MGTKQQRDKRVKRSRVYPPIRQMDAEATPEQVARALLRKRSR